MPAQPASTTPVTDLSQLLRTMTPIAHEGVYVFCRLVDATALKALLSDTGPLATFREAEGLTVVIAKALGDAGISCNVMAAACHDHLFVPVARGADALAILQNLQRTAATSTA